MDGGGAIGGVGRQRHPVAGDGVASLPRFMAQATGDPGAEGAGIRDHRMGFTLLDDDAAGDVAGARVRGESLLQRIGPAILFNQERRASQEVGILAPKPRRGPSGRR